MTNSIDYIQRVIDNNATNIAVLEDILAVLKGETL